MSYQQLLCEISYNNINPVTYLLEQANLHNYVELFINEEIDMSIFGDICIADLKGLNVNDTDIPLLMSIIYTHVNNT